MGDQMERRMQDELRQRIEKKTENLRDHFAMAALTGFLANPMPREFLKSDDIVDACYEVADFMLEARKRD